MVDSSVAITAGSGTAIRTVTNAGVDSGAHQQVLTLADSAGNLLGTPGGAVPVSAGYVVLASGNLAAVNATYDGVTDLSMYSSLRVQITGTWSGSIIFQVSVDGTWTNKFVSGSSTTVITNTAGNGTWEASISGRYFRLLMSSYTSGTAVATVLYTTAPASLATVNVTSLPIGTNGIGSVFIGSSTLVQYTATSAASTNATNMKSTSGRLQEMTITNTSATAMFFKLYNKASAPTLASDVPVAIWRVAPTGSAGDTVQLDFGPNGKHFTTGISWALTGAVGATDTTAVSAGSLISATYI